MADIYKTMEKEVEELFSTYDKNGDEKITKQEAVEHFKSKGSKFPERQAYFLFEAFDTDKDGEITLLEVQMDAYKRNADKIKEHNIAADVASYLMKYDSDGDKVIAFDEMLKNFETVGSKDPKKATEFIFSQIDSDGDKFITLKELEVYSKKAYDLTGPSQ